MYFSLIIFQIGIPGAKSLKDKRKVTTSVINKLKNRFNIAIAEDRDNEKIEVSKIYLLSLNTNRRELDSTVSTIENFLSNLPDAVLLSFEHNEDFLSNEEYV
ncbi:MAG TPA: DUF503 family protein [Caldisericia bacterium]|nr:DUF503 domain-containing protein [bacterium]HOK18486.1 DUF503 family protein [Caldisericia bacterium]HOL83105.1 DUF503 family protein [Caldisericia bacterium]HPB34629.1 DUF503 family protein [Caldisericia bacterium]HPC56383.1 DUF503 family protein [Caldisericia bacterium]